MSEAYFIGVDLHQAVIQLCVLDAEGEIVAEQRFRGDSLNDGLKVVKFILRFKNARVAVEAIGMNRWFVDALRPKCDVVVADASKLNLRASGKKTDRRDAYEIARRLRLGDVDKNAKTYYATDEEYGLRKIVRLRRAAVKMRQQLINHIRATLRAYRIPQPKGQLFSKKSVKALEELTGLSEELQFCLGELVVQLQSVQASIARYTQRIEIEARRPEVAALMESVPQLGAQTALTMFVELGDVDRFDGTRAVASYAGLCPRVNNSADASHHGRITKRGNRDLRCVVVEWAVRLLTKDATVQAWAAPRLKRMHKHKVRTALARRLLIGVYITLRRGEVFSLERCLAA